MSRRKPGVWVVEWRIKRRYNNADVWDPCFLAGFYGSRAEAGVAMRMEATKPGRDHMSFRVRRYTREGE